MPTPTAGDLHGAIYMLRNLNVGDDEQTRINDSEYVEIMQRVADPATADKFVALLTRPGINYDGACELFIRTLLAGISRGGVEKLLDTFLGEFIQKEDVDEDDGETLESAREGLREDVLGEYDRLMAPS